MRRPAVSVSAEGLVQGALAAAWAVAAFKLWNVARHGMWEVSLFRWLAAAVATAWCGFYIAAAYQTLFLDLAWIGTLPDVARTIQPFTVTLFLVWGLLFDENHRRLRDRETDRNGRV